MPEQIIGHYKIISPLGAGGMGEVYLAEDTTLGRRVAIKFLSPDLISDTRANKRLMKEARAAAALDHPNICAIHEVGEDDGQCFIVMQFLDGETLQHRLMSHKPSTKESLSIATQVAEAIADAHSHGIIHRDIKPANVMLTRRGQAKVMDFGLAKQLTSGAEDIADIETQTLLSTPGAIIGTLPYMSPEQVRGESLDERSDIFSFGVLFYELLSGRQPFAQNSVAATASAILTHDPPVFVQESSETSLQDVVFKCLEKDRDRRYSSMTDVLRDLASATEDITSGRSIDKLTVPTSVVATSAQRRLLTHRWRILPLILGAMLLLTAIAGYLLWVRGRTGTTQPAIKSLAVLPLKPLDASDNSLGLGIADAVIRKISQTGQLIVRPTSAVRHYLTEDIDGLTAARQLDVDAVLEGSVQRNNDRLRVSVNLMQSSNGVSLWSDNFDMRESDIFAIQDTVAQRVANRLKLQLDPTQQSRLAKQQTTNPVAYELYIKGIDRFDQRSYGEASRPQSQAAIDFLKKAVEVDPNYALAHAQLAYAYAWVALFLDPRNPQWAELAQEEIDKAQSLDPQLAETHIPKYLLLWSGYGGWQIEAAIRELLLAQELNPNVGHFELGSLYQHAGLEDLASQEFDRAMAIDPTSEHLKLGIVTMHAIVRDYDGQLAAAERLLNDKTADVWYLMAKGRFDEAQQLIEKSERSGNNPYLANHKAFFAALKGDFSAAEAQIPLILSQFPAKDPEYHHSTYDVACIYALEGKSVEAVKWLNETAGTGFPSYPLFERDPFLNRIRRTPEFLEFMTRMKALNEKWRSEFKR